MSLWGRLALVAAGGLLGAAATRLARTPGQDLAVRPGAPAPRPARAGDWRSRLYRFAAEVRTGMAEREAELRASLGAPAPGARPSSLPGARPGALGTPGALDAPDRSGAPTDPSTDRQGKHR
ncbi:hypothetical protein ACSNO4_01380 [Kocuria flava]|uniref:hypothetical protein n=1 Tax=Kocuria flava TaxID=446860 RepID=UPI003F1B5296